MQKLSGLSVSRPKRGRPDLREIVALAMPVSPPSPQRRRAPLLMACAATLAAASAGTPAHAQSPGTTAFIMDDPTDLTSVSAATHLDTVLQSAGLASGNVTIGGTLPNSLSAYSQVWDVRYNNGTNDVVSPANTAIYDTYLQGGGRLFLMGENQAFVTRDNSIAALLESAGSGTITIGSATILMGTADIGTIIGSLATTPNTVPTVKFYATGEFTSLGSGTCIVEDASGNCAGAVWATGKLANATAGTVASILDVNFLTPDTAGHDADLFTQNLSQFFVAQGSPPQSSNILAGQSYDASLLGTSVNPVFQGGLLVVDHAGGTYAEAFSLDNSGTNRIDQAGNASVFSGVFSDAVAGTPGGIVIVNSGTGGSVTFTAVETYSGATTIAAGATLALSGAGSIAASSGVADNGVLDISETTSGATVASLSGAGGVALGANTLTLANATGSFTGAIGGTGGLTVAAGIETLGGANTYTGATTIAAGATLALTGAGSIAASSVADNGVFDISATASGATVPSLSGSGAVALGAQSLTLTNAVGAFSGVIAGSGGLTIAAGAETLGGVNSYTGATTIAAGATLALTGGGGIAASSGVANAGVLDISATTSGAAIVTLSGGGGVALGAQTLMLTNAADNFSGPIAGTGGLTVAGGAETLSGANTYTGATTISGATLRVAADSALGASSGGLVMVNGTLVALASLASARPISLSGANQIVTAGSIAVALSGPIGGAGGLSLAGGGAVTLSGANSFAGGLSVAGNTTLVVGSDAALGAQSNVLTLGDTGTSGTLLATASFTSARPVVVASGGGTIDAADNVLTLTGQITQIGILQVVAGPGGNVVLTGPTTVSALTLGSGSSTNGGTVNAAAGVTVAGGASFANSGAVDTSVLTVDGRIANGGTIGATTSTTIASGGFVSNNGVLTSPSLTVAGTLRGTGTVNAATSVAGTLAPGNSPGTLTFNAPVRLVAGSTSEFDIDGTGTATGAGNFSRVIVAGAGNGYTAAGTLLPLLRGITGAATNTYVPPLGQQYRIVQAAGGVTGTFAAFAQPAGLAAHTVLDALYSANAVTLVSTPAQYGNLVANGLAETGAEAAIGRALDAIRPAPNARMTAAQAAVFVPLYELPAAAIAPSFDEMAPTVYSDGAMAARNAWYEVAGTVADQLAARRAGAGAAGDATMATAPGAFGSTIWTTGISQSASVAGSGQPGYHGTVAGAVAGIDVPVATSLVPGLVAGFAIGGATTNTATGGSTEDGSLVQFAAYGGAQFGRVFVDGQASYLHVDRGVRRDVGVVNGSSVGSGQANGGGGSVEGGVRLTYAAWTIEPVLGLSALSLKTGAIAESGGVADVRIGAQSLGSLQSLAAARVERSFGIGPTQIVHATATLGWQHEFLDVAPKSAVSFASFGTPLSVAAAPISRDAAVLGAGFDVPVTSAVAVYASYRQVLGDRSSSENATAGLRVVW